MKIFLAVTLVKVALPFRAFDEVVSESEVDNTRWRASFFRKSLSNETIAILTHEHLHHVRTTLHSCAVHRHQTLKQHKIPSNMYNLF